MAITHLWKFHKETKYLINLNLLQLYTFGYNQNLSNYYFGKFVWFMRTSMKSHGIQNRKIILCTQSKVCKYKLFQNQLLTKSSKTQCIPIWPISGGTHSPPCLKTQIIPASKINISTQVHKYTKVTCLVNPFRLCGVPQFLKNTFYRTSWHLPFYLPVQQ